MNSTKAFPASSRLRVAVATVLTIGGQLLAAQAEADEATDKLTADKAALITCLNAHTTPADQQTVLRLLGLVIYTATPSGETVTDLPHDFQVARDTAVTDTASLFTRIAHQDCKPEVQAAVADKLPNGGAFALILSQLLVPLQQSLRRAGTVIGVDIVRKMDPDVIVELGMAGGSSSAPATSDTAVANTAHSYSRVAAAGTRIQLEFIAPLNPDCSTMGDAVVRITAPPSHGTAAVESGTGFTAYPPGNQRYHCNEHSRRGQVLYYKAKSGYTGHDSLTYQTIYPTGVEQHYTVDLTVN